MAFFHTGMFSGCEVAIYLLMSRVNCSPKCSNDTFYDNIRGECLSCMQYCNNDPPRECTYICSKPAECPKHFYYDKAIGRCRSCVDICHQAEVRGTQESCQQLCPVDVDPTSDRPAVMTRAGTTAEKNSRERTDYPSHMTVIILCLALLVFVSLATAIVVMWRCVSVRICNCKMCLKRHYTNTPTMDTVQEQSIEFEVT